MHKNESGQALILVLLSLSVVLTLVLYILSRSVTDVAISSQQESSVRAFSAAEAGIERALVVGTDYSSSIGDANYTANVSNIAQGSTNFAYPISLSNGDSATFWLAGHDGSGNLTTSGSFTGTQMTICWGDAATSPAIEVTILYEVTPGDLSTVRIARAALDPNAAPRGSFTSAFGSGSCTIAGQTYAFQKNIVFSGFSPAVNNNGLILARVKMFYNNVPQNVGVSVPNGTLPSQGQNITSTGVSGGSNREISVFTGWPEFPFVSNTIFSPNGVTK
jgi:Tfp pilus assembly protein PilX